MSLLLPSRSDGLNIRDHSIIFYYSLVNFLVSNRVVVENFSSIVSVIPYHYIVYVNTQNSLILTALNCVSSSLLRSPTISSFKFLIQVHSIIILRNKARKRHVCFLADDNLHNGNCSSITLGVVLLLVLLVRTSRRSSVKLSRLQSSFVSDY